MTVRYTSDLHDGHINILTYMPNRKFKDLDHQREHIISSWNSVVAPEDTTYILGDVCMGDRALNVPRLTSRLNGKLVLTRGNHDKNAEKMLTWGFHEVHNKLVMDIDGYHVLLQHHPPSIEEAVKFHYCLHGHIHSTPYSNTHREDEYVKVPHAIDVGVDRRGFAPLTFAELIEGVEPNSP